MDWVSDGNVSTNNPEADGATESSIHEKVTSTELVDKEEKPDQGEDSLDNTENTSGEERSVGASDTDVLEDSWAVVVDGVDARTVLPEEESSTKEHSPLNLSVLGDSAEWLPEAESDSGSLLLEGSVDSSNLLHHVDVGGAQGSDPAKVLEGMLTATFAHKPSWRLFDEEETDEHETSWDELDGERNKPLLVGWCHGLRNSVVDPEANKSTNLPAKLVETDKATTNRRRRKLGNVDRSQVGCTADSKAGEDTSTVEETKATRAIDTKHETSTENEDSRVELETLLTAEEVTGDVGADGTKEGAGLVERNNVGGNSIRLSGAVLTPVEFGLERRKSDGASNESTVVTNHDCAESGDGCAIVNPPVVDGLGRRPVLVKSEKTHDEKVFPLTRGLIVFSQRRTPRCIDGAIGEVEVQMQMRKRTFWGED